MTAERVIDDRDLRTLKEVERFLFREARALDDHDYEKWLSLLTNDISYVVNAQQMREADASPVVYTLIDEPYESLKSRIDQIKTARLSRAENPRSLTRRFVSNIEIIDGDTGGEFSVVSNIMAFRARGSVARGGFYVAQRSDLLRTDQDGLRLARREVLLDHALLFDGALTTIL